MYNQNCLEWHLGDERKLRTPQGTVWSCQVAGESFEFAFNRLAAAHAKSQDHRASCGVFAFGRPSDSRYVTGPAWGGKSRNTALCYTPEQKATSVGLATGKGLGTTVEQGPIYKRINPSWALGLLLSF